MIGEYDLRARQKATFGISTIRCCLLPGPEVVVGGDPRTWNRRRAGVRLPRRVVLPGVRGAGRSPGAAGRCPPALLLAPGAHRVRPHPPGAKTPVLRGPDRLCGAQLRG